MLFFGIFGGQRPTLKPTATFNIFSLEAQSWSTADLFTSFSLIRSRNGPESPQSVGNWRNDRRPVLIISAMWMLMYIPEPAVGLLRIRWKAGERRPTCNRPMPRQFFRELSPAAQWSALLVRIFLLCRPFLLLGAAGENILTDQTREKKRKKEKNWPRIGPTWPTEIRRKRCHRSTALAIIGRVFHRKFPTKFSYFLFSLRLRPLNRYVTLLHLIDL